MTVAVFIQCIFGFALLVGAIAILAIERREHRRDFEDYSP